jgi:hypothetical protein
MPLKVDELSAIGGLSISAPRPPAVHSVSFMSLIARFRACRDRVGDPAMDGRDDPACEIVKQGPERRRRSAGVGAERPANAQTWRDQISGRPLRGGDELQRPRLPTAVVDDAPEAL